MQMETEKRKGIVATMPSQSVGRQPTAEFLARLARHDLLVADEELRRAMFGSADDRQQSPDLLAGDQPQLPARRTGENSPIGIVLFADFAGIFEDENGSRLHLFGDPLA